LTPPATWLGAASGPPTELLSFNFYGCRFIPALGVDLGDDDLYGGEGKLRVVLDTPVAQFPGVMTVFCIVGSNRRHRRYLEAGIREPANQPRMGSMA
jgi:hypothetical protein